MFIGVTLSYLSERYQSVVITAYFAQSNVPQDFNLGPLLFIAYINHITISSIEHCMYHLFADDLKKRKQVLKKVEYRLDITSIQEDLGRIEIWSKSNGMELIL